MNKLIDKLAAFARDNGGGQVVEYALVISLVSIALALALGDAVSGLTATFQDLAARVSTCFADPTC